MFICVCFINQLKSALSLTIINSIYISISIWLLGRLFQIFKYFLEIRKGTYRAIVTFVCRITFFKNCSNINIHPDIREIFKKISHEILQMTNHVVKSCFEVLCWFKWQEMLWNLVLKCFVDSNDKSCCEILLWSVVLFQISSHVVRSCFRSVLLIQMTSHVVKSCSEVFCWLKWRVMLWNLVLECFVDSNDKSCCEILF